MRRTHLVISLLTAITLAILSLAVGLCSTAWAMEPPRPGMIDDMKARGQYEHARKFADRLANHQLKPALRGKALPDAAPADIAEQIMQHLGESLDAKGAKAVSAASAKELDWVELDLNHDRTVDERDILALGFTKPKGSAAFPSLGTSKAFCLLLDFEDYPAFFPQAEVQTNLFGDGTMDYSYRSLKYYYDLASYHQLNVDGMAYGWHRASHPRTYYHPNDDADYPESWTRQAELVKEAILAYDALGEDFSQYDNDGDGYVDYFLVVYSGPVGAWATFWWGYFGVSLPADFVVDGVTFPAYSWQWERYYGFADTPPEPPHWDPYVTIHETGHALGLPDYYDYDGGVGPPGGLGGLDQMDGNWGDHNSFSKYILGWFTPTFAFTNLDNEPLQRSNEVGDAVIVMPGFDPVTPWSEYFMAQYRYKGGLDASYPASGMLLWHIDARVNNNGWFRWDNSYTDHKLVKLMEADGLEEIENWGGADAEDFYQTGNELSPASTPNSHRYDDTDSGITVNDFSSPNGEMTADFILYQSNPPTVNILSPTAGDTVSGNVPVHVTASDDVAVDKVQILIDGLLVNTNNNSTDFTYTWNSLVDFNKTLEITARAWDEEGQAGSMTITVTVDNTGVIEITDDFEASLGQWRSINEAMTPRGQVTQWARRVSPDDPAPLGSGREAYVRANRNGEWCGAHDRLRAMRLDATGFTRGLQVKFAYRCRAGFVLWATSDEGLTWQRLDSVPESGGWSWFNRVYDLAPGNYYLRLDYDGDAHTDDYSALSANIDDVLIREVPSEPPTIDITSHNTDDTVSGNVVFTADAQDDNAVARVYWYLNDGLAATDEDGVPWEYGRDTTGDDNAPAIRLKAIAEDADGLPSLPDEVTLTWRNDRPYPVFDNLEADDSRWGYQNDGIQPQWQYVTNFGHSGNHSVGFVIAEGGSWGPGNYDGLWFSGDPPALGRQCIDLSGAGVHNPELTFFYRADQPSNGSMSLYFYNTWFGWQEFGSISQDEPQWAEKTFSLAPYAGQSGQVVFWIWGDSEVDGLGLWIDDLRIGNRAPVIESLSAMQAYPGMVLTITGRKFGDVQGTSAVTFFDGVDVPAFSIMSWLDTQIVLKVPAAAATGPVFVTVDSENSNAVMLDITNLVINLYGLDNTTVYTAVNPPELSVLTNPETQRVELRIDSGLADVSLAAPFDDLAIPLLRLKNGGHYAYASAYRGSEKMQSKFYPFMVYSLRGDVNEDGAVGLPDVAAMQAVIGMTASDPEFRPWFDPDGDGACTEADVSYIGYHFGTTINLF